MIPKDLAQSLIRLLIERNVTLTFTPVTGGLRVSPDQVELMHPVRRERYEREQSAVADGSKVFGRNQAALQMSGHQMPRKFKTPVDSGQERSEAGGL